MTLLPDLIETRAGPPHAVLDGLGDHTHDLAIAIDTLVERSGLTADQVSSMLVVLELHGQIASAPGGLYTRIH